MHDGMVCQSFAKTQDNNVISIYDVNGKKKEKYFCLSCGSEVIPKQGDIKQWHFAHKNLTSSCSHETYLHKLAKNKICEAFRNNDTFNIEVPQVFYCPKAEDCIWSNYECNHYKNHKIYDLKTIYDTCVEEQKYKNFIADLLIYDSLSSQDPIFIEIFVSHKCTTEKYNSGIRIIELKISSEEDIESITKFKTLSASEDITFHNFIARRRCEEYSCKKGLWMFVLYSNFGHEILKTDCEEYNCSYDNVIYSLTGSYKIEGKGIDDYDYYELIGICLASTKFQAFKNCNLCKYHKNNNNKSLNGSIFCCLYKRLGTAMTCSPSAALKCRGFKLDEKVRNELLARINRYELYERLR